MQSNRAAFYFGQAFIVLYMEAYACMHASGKSNTDAMTWKITFLTRCGLLNIYLQNSEAVWLVCGAQVAVFKD